MKDAKDGVGCLDRFLWRMRPLNWGLFWLCAGSTQHSAESDSSREEYSSLSGKRSHSCCIKWEGEETESKVKSVSIVSRCVKRWKAVSGCNLGLFPARVHFSFPPPVSFCFSPAQTSPFSNNTNDFSATGKSSSESNIQCGPRLEAHVKSVYLHIIILTFHIPYTLGYHSIISHMFNFIHVS